MQVRKLSDAGGVEVEGVDLTAQHSDEQLKQLAALYDEHGLVVFRDQKLTKQQLIEATNPFGGPMIEAPADAPDPECPGVIVISTRGTTGDVVPKDPEELVGDLEWHTDQGYITNPNRGKILYGVQVPEVGGKTGFIDGQVTYAALSDAMKAKIDKLHVIFSWARAESYLARNREYRIDGDAQMATDRFPNIAFPLVLKHPVTGAKILNAAPLWSAGIVEMPGAEGDALLEELKAHLLQPKFQYWHQYRVGDAVLWDNWRSIHAASGTPGRYVRTIWSVIVQGGPEFGEVLAKKAA